MSLALLRSCALLCHLHGCAGVPTSLTSVATSFEASCERLPCGIPSAECFVWSLHAPSLSVSQSLISSSSVVCSRSATLDRATVLLLRWNPAGPYSGSHLESSGSSAPVSVSVHPSRCSDHLFREWNLFCFISFLQCLCVAVFWHCISAATSTLCTAVKLQCSAALAGCTAPVATSTVFATRGRSCRHTAPGAFRSSAH